MQTSVTGYIEHILIVILCSSPPPTVQYSIFYLYFELWLGNEVFLLIFIFYLVTFLDSEIHRYHIGVPCFTYTYNLPRFIPKGKRQLCRYILCYHVTSYDSRSTPPNVHAGQGFLCSGLASRILHNPLMTNPSSHKPVTCRWSGQYTIQIYTGNLSR